MPITNRDMVKAARERTFTATFDIDNASTQSKALVSPDSDIRITGVSFVYSVATNTGTLAENFQVGTAADGDMYFIGLAVISQALGVIENKTLLSTALLPAGTALLVNKVTGTTGANTGEITVVVRYEPVDPSAWVV